MGWHFLNPKYTAFDVTKPAILVYAKRASRWQLVAFEWVFPEKPTKKPLPGASYGSFGAACHYKDGTFVFVAVEADCAEKSPESGSAFGSSAPGPRDPPSLALVPEPGRHLRRDEPADEAAAPAGCDISRTCAVGVDKGEDVRRAPAHFGVSAPQRAGAPVRTQLARRTARRRARR